MTDLITELHSLAQRMAAAGETDAPATLSLAAEEIGRLRGEVEKLTRRNGLIIEEAEREGQHNRQLRIERFRQFGNEDCWIYGGDDHDNLETLVCPVVMSPQHLIEILQERDRLKALIQPFKAFTDAMLGISWQGNNVDGVAVQEFAIKNGLLKEIVQTEPCSDERCICAEVAEFPITCNRKTYPTEISLSAHDAEVIEQFARELGVFDPEYDDQEYIEVPRYAIKDYANQLRQQVKEVQS